MDPNRLLVADVGWPMVGAVAAGNNGLEPNNDALVADGAVVV